MRMSFKKGAVAFASAALAVSATATTMPASASHGEITIQVGAQLGPRSLPAESMRFFGPRSLVVHQGTLINFDFRGFHTATMLPAGVGADDWLYDNAGSGGTYGFAAPDFDDGPNEYKDNFSKVVSPTNPGCGLEGQSACSYTGAAVLNSGAPFELPGTFAVSVDAAPGSSFWVVDLVHHAMRMRIKVVADPSAATPQSTIDQLRTSQLAQDLDLAAATHKKYSSKSSARTLPSGKKVYDAWAGVDSRHVALYSFYPKTINIPKNATIRWHFGSLVHEDHTVSMPDPGIFSKLQFDESMCDPDGDGGPGPDTEAGFDPQGQPECPGGSVVETDISHQFWGGTGNRVLKSPNDVEHSGIRGPHASEAMSPPAASGPTYDVKFAFNTQNNKPIKYFCFLHPMQGKINVGG